MNAVLKKYTIHKLFFCTVVYIFLFGLYAYFERSSFNLKSMRHLEFLLVPFNANCGNYLFFNDAFFGYSILLYVNQSCKSDRAFWVGFGPKVDKNFGFNLGLRHTFCLRCTKIYSK